MTSYFSLAVSEEQLYQSKVTKLQRVTKSCYKVHFIKFKAIVAVGCTKLLLAPLFEIL